MTGQQSQEYQISRRVALATLATLPTALLATVQFGSFTGVVVEEFFAQCTASITACFHLLGENGLSIVEQVLPTYVPSLKGLAQYPSRYQSHAAYLAAQGCLLSGLLVTHHLPVPRNIQQRFAYCQEAIKYSKLSGDKTLQVMSLIHYGYTLYYKGNMPGMLQAYLQAVPFIESIPDLLKSKLYAGLAHAYAQNGLSENALMSIELAHRVFPTKDVSVPLFVSTDCGEFSLIMDEGRTQLVLGNMTKARSQASLHYQQSEQVFAQLQTLQPDAPPPDRFLVEIINQQTLAAIKRGDLEAFEQYLIRGMKSAKALGSQQRLQEFANSYSIARDIWPDEKRVWELADLFFSRT